MLRYDGHMKRKASEPEKITNIEMKYIKQQ